MIPAHASKSLVYIGTYTQNSESEGIYLFHFDDKTGQLSPAGIAGLSTNPSFLAVNSEKNLLFAVGETRDFNAAKSGSIASFKIDPDDSKLAERTAFVQHEGSSLNKKRQKAPHAHSINLDPKNERAYVADLGIDELSTLPQGYEGKNGTVEIRIVNDQFVYASNRGHDSIACYNIGADGKLGLVEIESTGGKAPRNFGIHPSGKFLIAANRNSNTLKVFAIDQQTGELSDTGFSAGCPKPACVKFHTLE